jgi:hypothetical protein
MVRGLSGVANHVAENINEWGCCNGTGDDWMNCEKFQDSIICLANAEARVTVWSHCGVCWGAWGRSNFK